MDEEFNKFWVKNENEDPSWPGFEWYNFALFVWNKSARRADKRAREECKRIALQYSQAYGQIDDAMAIARDIQATIQEEST